MVGNQGSEGPQSVSKQPTPSPLDSSSLSLSPSLGSSLKRGAVRMLTSLILLMSVKEVHERRHEIRPGPYHLTPARGSHNLTDELPLMTPCHLLLIPLLASWP